MRETILAKAASLGLSGQLAGVRFLPFSIAELIRDRQGRRRSVIIGTGHDVDAGLRSFRAAYVMNDFVE